MLSEERKKKKRSFIRVTGLNVPHIYKTAVFPAARTGNTAEIIATYSTEAVSDHDLLNDDHIAGRKYILSLSESKAGIIDQYCNKSRADHLGLHG